MAAARKTPRKTATAKRGVKHKGANPRPVETPLLLSESDAFKTLQNDELRRTQLELEVARDRYVDLYDFSPAGHLTLDTARHDYGGQSEGRDAVRRQPERADRTITRALHCIG